MTFPQADIEREFYKKGFLRVAGVDEVGRGALAGPVVAAAVILPMPLEFFENIGVRDSKLLSPSKRVALSDKLRSLLFSWSVGEATVSEINALNIRRATLLAMRRAVEGLAESPDVLLVDGREIVPDLVCKQEPFTGGDRRVLSIAAASIIAKVYRDNMMSELDKTYAGYGLAENKGYGTAQHRDGLLLQGVSSIHRTVFCKTFLEPFRQRAIFKKEVSPLSSDSDPLV
ncbi:ribonuclease HII [Leptospirillum ferriphilum]|jgi:ribonuclease HII|uniref:Ribonuclease HII n=3 Tax=Leptospirillum ferriphilum TaxID=178606 RepID=A0A059XYS2_9BACT|nr:ribonuclease HII [Leptospirillum ferriphilum]MCL5259953.1 ribonuclease HII [Nitrospirota bacterium]AFS53331.1 ribonuclease HII [Leptospirillum ferriphilum ML-04]AIA30367.1 ribonuclease HII [Leptospirillum ferriphilum YSK]OOH75089.1 ribonuclease HII [Leptospirillum ferriphilum]OOH78480.1 ribonuclease HII [Leptospirillum ferriphilum]